MAEFTTSTSTLWQTLYRCYVQSEKKADREEDSLCTKSETSYKPRHKPRSLISTHRLNGIRLRICNPRMRNHTPLSAPPIVTPNFVVVIGL